MVFSTEPESNCVLGWFLVSRFLLPIPTQVSTLYISNTMPGTSARSFAGRGYDCSKCSRSWKHYRQRVDAKIVVKVKGKYLEITILG